MIVKIAILFKFNSFNKNENILKILSNGARINKGMRFHQIKYDIKKIKKIKKIYKYCSKYQSSSENN